MDAPTRDTFDAIGPDGQDVRLYEHGDVRLPSVTSILKTRDEDLSGLYAWQDENDGEGDAAHHEHLFWYKRHRGTLCHWYALKTLDPSLEWSADEAESMYRICNVRNLNEAERHPEVHDARPRDVLYSVLKDRDAVGTWGDFYTRYDPDMSPNAFDAELKAVYEADRDFFVDAFERLADKHGIDEIVAVERFLLDDEFGYAGQADLVYRNGDGEAVMADLKTSSSCRTKHKLQTAAYASAIERDDDIPVDEVDRLEVIRIHPDSGAYAVHTDDDQGGAHSSRYWRRSYDDLWREFRDLAESFEYDDPDTDDDE